MKRRIMLKLAVFLLLGAIVNVAVAWGLAALIRVDKPKYLPEERTQFLDEHRGRVWHYQLIRPGAVRYVYQFDDATPSDLVVEHDAFAPAWSQALQHDPAAEANVANHPADNQFQNLIVEDARGWPLLCMRCLFVVAAASDKLTAIVTSVDGGLPLRLGDQQPTAFGVIELRPRFWYSQALPFRPIWPGFAINTIFYAAILWMLFTAPGIVRRRMRIKRGLCPACAYPVGTWGGDVCTECGNRLPRNERRYD